MSRYLHIVTTGTSVVRNASSHELLDAGLRGKLKLWATAPPGKGEDIEAASIARPGSHEFKAILGYVSGNPRRASAELNALIGYLEHLEEEGVRGVQHHIVLLSTDTGTGWLSTRIIEEYLKTLVDQDLARIWGIKSHRIIGVESHRIEELGLNFNQGILNLIAWVKKIILDGKDKYDRILANPTGGFKPETATILVTAGLLGIDTVYYIHEAMKNIVELPVLPLEVKHEARKLLENILEDRISRAEQKLLRKLGIQVTYGKPTPWAKKLIQQLLY